MVEELTKYIEEHNLLNRHDNILLAVSGGIDSMVMAHLFLSVKANFGIAHCNFNLRGTESDEDEAFVKNFAFSNNIPFYSERFDTTGFASEKGISIQMAARELRYRWFEEIRLKNKFSSIAVAHNLNDNVETFLINLTRGTGLAGLTGMKPRYRNIIRPLLFATRNAIIDYSKRNGVSYREDRSNSEVKYTRNKLRHNIIPQFKEINPSFETTITETAGRLNDINDLVSAYITIVREKVSIIRENTTVFKVNALQEFLSGSTILFELFRPFGIGKGQIKDLVSLIKGKTGSMIKTEDYRIIKNRKEILVSEKADASEEYFEIAGIEDFAELPGNYSASVKKVNPGFIIPGSNKIACVDADKVTFPLIIRRWSHGDTFYPLGMRQKKKLSDYFIDNKFSLPEKENCLLLESAGKIVWIINSRLDNRFRITRSTKRALIIESGF